MPATATFIETPGWQYRALSGAEGEACIHQATEAVRTAIIENVPVRTGQYQMTFERGLSEEHTRGDRGTPAEQLVTGSSIWHIIEFGSRNNMPYAPMRRGVEQAGMRWEGSGR